MEYISELMISPPGAEAEEKLFSDSMQPMLEFA